MAVKHGLLWNGNRFMRRRPVMTTMRGDGGRKEFWLVGRLQASCCATFLWLNQYLANKVQYFRELEYQFCFRFFLWLFTILQTAKPCFHRFFSSAHRSECVVVLSMDEVLLCGYLKCFDRLPTAFGIRCGWAKKWERRWEFLGVSLWHFPVYSILIHHPSYRAYVLLSL